MSRVDQSPNTKVARLFFTSSVLLIVYPVGYCAKDNGQWPAEDRIALGNMTGEQPRGGHYQREAGGRNNSSARIVGNLCPQQPCSAAVEAVAILAE